MGIYCSYCERRVPIGLAVEHKIPKDPCPELKLEWDNFLLGCITCNSIKGDKVYANDDVLWPDRNNTTLALKYAEGGFVDVSEGISVNLKIKAKTLIDLIGLDRHDADAWPQPTRRDKRWSEREKVWKVAEHSRSYFVRLEESCEALKLVVDAAIGLGFFSVWLTVFREHSLVRNALIDAVPGTAKNCFSGEGEPIPRPGAEI